VVPFSDIEAAVRAKRAFVAKIPGTITIRTAVGRYAQHLRRKGDRESSIGLTTHRLGRYLQADEVLSSVTADNLAERYSQRVGLVAVDTHRNELAELKTFWRWVVAQKLVGTSPAENVQPVGRRRAGKLQLRVAELQEFWRVASARRDEGAVAACAVLVLGLRSRELRALRVRDLDVVSGAAFVWVDDSKTPAGRRQVPLLSPDLISKLQGLAVGKDRDAYLFSSWSSSGYRDASWLRKHVRVLCREAGVPEVTVHSLRGSAATIQALACIPRVDIARSLGHTRESVTDRHYVAPWAAQEFMGRIFGSSPPPDRNQTRKVPQNMELTGIEPAASRVRFCSDSQVIQGNDTKH
jgi:integrase